MAEAPEVKALRAGSVRNGEDVGEHGIERIGGRRIGSAAVAAPAETHPHDSELLGQTVHIATLRPRNAGLPTAVEQEQGRTAAAHFIGDLRSVRRRDGRHFRGRGRAAGWRGAWLPAAAGAAASPLLPRAAVAASCGGVPVLDEEAHAVHVAMATASAMTGRQRAIAMGRIVIIPAILHPHGGARPVGALLGRVGGPPVQSRVRRSGIGPSA